MSDHKRILAVDDEERVLFVTQHALQRLGSGFLVETASGGREGLERLQQQHYDLVVTDIRMPGIDGVELTRALQSGNGETVVIWLTAYDSPELRAQARELGVDRYLTKPVPIGTIREVVRAALDRADRTCIDHEEPHAVSERVHQCRSEAEAAQVPA
jgi:two-component system response regulator AtoC